MLLRQTTTDTKREAVKSPAAQSAMVRLVIDRCGFAPRSVYA